MFFSKLLKTCVNCCLSIVPIVVIVLILHWSGVASLVDLTTYTYGSSEWAIQSWIDTLLLFVGGLVLIIGLALFSLGCERSLSLVGEHIGNSLSKQKNIWIVILVTFVLGALVTCAEPSITILASQTPINNVVFIVVISIGVGLFTAIGVLRIIKHKTLNMWLLAFYGLVFALILLIESNDSFLPLIFDAGGATTGSATVPFLLSLGASVAMVRGGSKSKDDTFGLIAIASVGPLLSLVIMFIFNKNGLGTYEFVKPVLGDFSIFPNFLTSLLPTESTLGTMLEVTISISPLLIIFLIYQVIFIKLPWAEIVKILIGFIYVFLGLVIFLDGVNSAMMPIGKQIGLSLGNQSNWVIILVAFILGMVTILTEPAIHVLTKQIKEISDGGISSFSVLLSLSIGVGIAIALCAVRAIFNFSMLYYLVPGFIIALGLTFFCPKMYTAMAFDSGGVASGPMASSFILPLIIGVVYSLCLKEGGDPSTIIMQRGFGVIGMVALTPILAIQMLGISVTIKARRREKLFRSLEFSKDDSQIIHF